MGRGDSAGNGDADWIRSPTGGRGMRKGRRDGGLATPSAIRLGDKCRAAPVAGQKSRCLSAVLELFQLRCSESTSIESRILEFCLVKVRSIIDG